MSRLRKCALATIQTEPAATGAAKEPAGSLQSRRAVNATIAAEANPLAAGHRRAANSPTPNRLIAAADIQ